MKRWNNHRQDKGAYRYWDENAMRHAPRDKTRQPSLFVARVWDPIPETTLTVHDA
jgi:hypothetical protein